MANNSDASEIKRSIVACGKHLDSKNLTPGTTGNISIFRDERIYCTPTGASLGNLKVEEISELDLEGNHLSGLQPTKESKIHVAIYKSTGNVNAVIHLHSTYATSISCLVPKDPENCLPALTPYLTMKGGDVALIPYFPPGDELICTPIKEQIQKGTRVMLLANHGSVIAASSLVAAMSIAEELEEACKIQLLTLGMDTRQLSQADISLLKTRYPLQ